MNTIYYGNMPIHDEREGFFALSAFVNFSISSAATVELELAPDHEAIPFLRCYDPENELVVEENGTVIFAGRIYDMSENMQGVVSVKAEDALAYLNDVTLPNYANYDLSGYNRIYYRKAGDLFQWYISEHNEKAEPMRHMFKGQCFVDELVVNHASSVHPTVREEINEKLLKTVGGYIAMRYENGNKFVDWIANRGVCSQKVEYGKNLVSYGDEIATSGVFSAVVPVSDGIELTDADDTMVYRITGLHCNGGAVVDDFLVDLFGYIEKKIEFTASTKEELAVLAADALATMDSNRTLQVSALDLALIGEADESIGFLQLVEFKNALTGSQALLLCTEKRLDLINPANTSYTLGVAAESLTSTINSMSSGGTSGGNIDISAVQEIANGVVSTHNSDASAHGLSDWAKQATKPSYAANEISGLATVSTTGSYNDLKNKPTIPSAVTDSTVSGWGYIKSFTETDPVFSASAASGITSSNISSWNAKYAKPSTGIPKTDLASAVQTSLGKADTALQSYTETDPTVPSWAKAANKPSYTASEIAGLASVATSGSYNDLSDKPILPSGKQFIEGDYNGWHYKRSDTWLEMWQTKTVAFKAGNNWSDTAMPTALPFADKHFAVLAHAEDWRVQNIYIGSANDSDRPGRNSFKIGATNSASSVVNSNTFVYCFGAPAPSWALFPARTRSSGWYSSVLDELGNVTITGHATTTKVGSVVPLSAITGIELPAGTYRLKVIGDETIKSVVSRNNPNTADCYHLSMYVAPDSSHTDPTQAVAFTIVDGATPTQAELDVMAGRSDTFTLAENGTALIISIYPPTAYEWVGSAQYIIERID